MAMARHVVRWCGCGIWCPWLKPSQSSGAPSLQLWAMDWRYLRAMLCYDVLCCNFQLELKSLVGICSHCNVHAVRISEIVTHLAKAFSLYGDLLALALCDYVLAVHISNQKPNCRALLLTITAMSRFVRSHFPTFRCCTLHVARLYGGVWGRVGHMGMLGKVTTW